METMSAASMNSILQLQGQKRSMERGNQTSAKPNPTRATQSNRLPCFPSLPILYRKGQSCSRKERTEELCWLYNTQTSPCAVILLEKKNKTSQTSLLFVFCLIRAKGAGRSQRSKQPLIKMITEFPFQVISMVHAVLTVQLLLLATV